MAIEVEAKAWVREWDAVERSVEEHCTFVRDFAKADRYFLCPGQESPSVTGRVSSAFRLRTDGEDAYVTFKEKRLRGSTEVNDEREFGVSDERAFLELSERIGCVEHFAKTKRGRHFECDGLTVELVHVEGLGDFLEVECVLPDADADAQAEAAARVESFLSRCGIPEDEIEPRTYMQLLSAVREGSGTPPEA